VLLPIISFVTIYLTSMFKYCACRWLPLHQFHFILQQIYLLMIYVIGTKWLTEAVLIILCWKCPGSTRTPKVDTLKVDLQKHSKYLVRLRITLTNAISEVKFPSREKPFEWFHWRNDLKKQGKLHQVVLRVISPRHWGNWCDIFFTDVISQENGLMYKPSELKWSQISTT